MIKESFLIGCIRRLREYGEGVAFANQDIKSLKDVIKNNVYSTGCLNQSGYTDIKEVIRIMGLDPDQADILLRMQVGEAIIRKAGGFPYPQLIKIPLIKPKNISNRELDNINKNDPVIQSLLSKVVKPVEPESKAESETEGLEIYEIDLSDNEKKLLDIIYLLQNNIKFSKAEIYKIAKLPSSTASKTLKRLEDIGLVKSINVKIKKGKGASSQFPVLTDYAYKATGKQKKSIGKGAGAEHELYQVVIADHLCNYKPEIEKIVAEKSIDVSIEANGRFICIEVQVSIVHIKENIEKDILMARANLVIIVSNDKTIKSKAESIIKDLPEKMKNRTQNYLLSEILTKDPDKFISEIIKREK